MTMDTFYTDVLILGAGAAGIRAAAAAAEQGADTVIVTPTDPTRSGSTFSPVSRGWGIQALMGHDRSDHGLDEFYRDIIRAGLDQCHDPLVRILTEESGKRVEDLIRYGIRFRKNTNGEFLRVKGCFSRTNRAFITSDFQNIRNTFIRMLKRTGAKLVRGHVLELIISDHQCFGAYVLNKTKEVVKLSAKATIIATGGGSGVYENHMMDEYGTGDGCALAHRAGAELMNMEFVQFMLGLKDKKSRSFLPIHELREPDMILDKNGRDVMLSKLGDQKMLATALDERLTHHPFSCRDRSFHIDLALSDIYKSGEKAFWHGGKKTVRQTEAVHFAHAFNGGIKINNRSESTVPGLYAAGEAAAGPHGADRVGGCMMTATQVFGERAGRYAARHSLGIGVMPRGVPEKDRRLARRSRRKMTGSHTPIMKMKQVLQKTMGRYAGVCRSTAGLKTCADRIDRIESEIMDNEADYHRDLMGFTMLRNMVETCKLIVSHSMARKESLGSFYNEDYPPVRTKET